ncbi:helix-turn-helix transcriptional regulator [Alloacidobacterium dinghuense]|uniref:Helix-turn-helix transcriptional regulator n=1 Tax=Alloacidobacterium dinghuense TaxID=2763107 RepID=A0A7G8BG58_9BACT|nr:AraC family transcriptional regulator [Alloacidobacterium dinghuense]QNI31528.1 helix-turn-helix transcriptional regulator [Alloacidobacterium dinghuense]
MIGKTRQESAAIKPAEYQNEESFDPELGQPRGVLRRPPPAAGKFRHARLCAAPELATWIDHYWMVSWDLRGLEPRLVESLPHPNVHIVFEKSESKAWGISTSKFSRVLDGKSHVFGIKFTPGGFFPFLGKSVSSLANSSIPVEQVFGREVKALERVILDTNNESEMTAAADAFLTERKPPPDEKVDLARQLVERILHEPDILTVDDYAARTRMSARALQRLFSRYVGATPKWVIRRYRLHELLELMHSGKRLDWAQLAIGLGYFDQAHLINDFKSITEYTPTEYPGLEPAQDS